jgi:hypothetical protein
MDAKVEEHMLKMVCFSKSDIMLIFTLSCWAIILTYLKWLTVKIVSDKKLIMAYIYTYWCRINDLKRPTLFISWMLLMNHKDIFRCLCGSLGLLIIQETFIIKLKTNMT